MLAPARSRCRSLGVLCGRRVRLSALGYGCAGRFLGSRWGAALWFWRWDGMPWGALRDRSCARREARGRIGFCAARRVFCGSLPMLAPDRSRCRLLGVLCGRRVRLSAFGYGCAGRFLGFWWWGALWFWRWGGMPLGALRDRSCARREARGEDRLLRCAQGFCGSLPMLAPDRSRCRSLGVLCGRRVRLSAFGYGCAERFLGFWWWGALWFWRWGGMPWGALRDRSCARREARGRIGFCAARSVFVDRFQCSLRIDPAAARWGRRMNQMQKRLGRRRFPVQHLGLFP
jgi:hypothetical protein